jgi:hypothetical protein
VHKTDSTRRMLHLAKLHRAIKKRRRKQQGIRKKTQIDMIKSEDK